LAVAVQHHSQKVLARYVIIRFITYMDSSVLEDPKVNHLPTATAQRFSLSVDLLQFVPEEEVWLAGQLSPHTRRAYKQDVAHFVRTMGITSADELRKVSRAAIVAWQNAMKASGERPRTIRRRLSALSSLFAHLVEHRAADENPVRDIKRPRVNRRQGTTRAFSTKEARMILDAPDPATLRGLRDRAILSVGFQAGPRRSEIVSLLVKDFHTNAGFKSLHFIRKGGEDLSLALNPQSAERIEKYLASAGHGCDPGGPLFRPVGRDKPRKPRRAELRRHLHPETVDMILRRYAAKMGLDSGYSAHSMRATFITTALDKGASLPPELLLHNPLTFGMRSVGPRAGIAFVVMFLFLFCYQGQNCLPLLVFMIAFVSFCVVAQIGAMVRWWRGEEMNTRYNGKPYLMWLLPWGEITIKRLEPFIMLFLGFGVHHLNHALGSFLITAAFGLVIRVSLEYRLIRTQAMDMNDAMIQQKIALENVRNMQRR